MISWNFDILYTTVLIDYHIYIVFQGTLKYSMVKFPFWTLHFKEHHGSAMLTYSENHCDTMVISVCFKLLLLFGWLDESNVKKQKQKSPHKTLVSNHSTFS